MPPRGPIRRGFRSSCSVGRRSLTGHALRVSLRRAAVRTRGLASTDRPSPGCPPRHRPRQEDVGRGHAPATSGDVEDGYETRPSDHRPVPDAGAPPAQSGGRRTARVAANRVAPGGAERAVPEGRVRRGRTPPAWASRCRIPGRGRAGLLGRIVCGVPGSDAGSWLAVAVSGSRSGQRCRGADGRVPVRGRGYLGPWVPPALLTDRQPRPAPRGCTRALGRHDATRRVHVAGRLATGGPHR